MINCVVWPVVESWEYCEDRERDVARYGDRGWRGSVNVNVVKEGRV
jgi:hypothetical protein